MSDSSHSAARLEELLVEQTHRPLDFEESAEVQKLLRELPDWEADELELAAAATLVAIGAGKDDAALPAELRAKILRDAHAHVLVEHEEFRAPIARDDTVRKAIPAEVVPIKRARRSVVAIFAAAAAILLAILGYLVWASTASTRAPGDLRSRLIAGAEDTVTAPWTAAGDPLGAGVSGDVVWSGSHQTGFMRFTGLAKNDVTELQYQLWIFDAERDERYPVDGGVFDINAETGEVIVAIDAKIRVTKATMFAVTVEKPGGVVVSSRERLVVLAKVI
jgi:anti-sigma-K factor RskA